jgi:Flp pilus assembly protein TadG
MGDDRGSTVLLGIMLLGVCLLGMAVLVDASAAFLQRRQLTSLADAAALAGAQAIDLDAYYEQGASDRTRLDPVAVVSRVRGHLRATGVATVPGLAVERIASDGRQVTVRLSAPLRLAFLSRVVDGDVVVEAVAGLAYRKAG